MLFSVNNGSLEKNRAMKKERRKELMDDDFNYYENDDSYERYFLYMLHDYMKCASYLKLKLKCHFEYRCSYTTTKASGHRDFRTSKSKSQSATKQGPKLSRVI
jgi:hypothetical protein